MKDIIVFLLKMGNEVQMKKRADASINTCERCDWQNKFINWIKHCAYYYKWTKKKLKQLTISLFFVSCNFKA